MSAKLDIIVVGATGYTGRITCKYLHSIKERAGRWGIAGRNAAKLADLNREHKYDVPTFVVDFTKPETLDLVCQSASCIISCAGPFTTVGMPVVEACVRNGTHYVDSTGEVNFVRQVAERFHEEAKKKGITIVPACGFECVPSDLGNYVVHREAKEAVKRVRCYFSFAWAGSSSGTFNSACQVLEKMEEADKSGTSLVPKDAVQPSEAVTARIPWYYREDGRIGAPALSAGGNERFVRRSNALRGSPASYAEVQEASALQAVTLTLKFYLTAMLIGIPPVRRFLQRNFFPADSTVGPSEESKKKSHFKLTFVGHTESGKRVVTVLSAKQDVYDATGVFLGESALSAITLSKRKEIKAGVLTPSTAFGDELVRRSREAGISIMTTVHGEAAPAESKKNA